MNELYTTPLLILKERNIISTRLYVSLTRYSSRVYKHNPDIDASSIALIDVLKYYKLHELEKFRGLGKVRFEELNTLLADCDESATDHANEADKGFQTRAEKIKINEIMADLLVPLREHTNDETKWAINRTLQILQETDVEA